MKTTVRTLLIVIPILLIAVLSVTYAMWVREEQLLQERYSEINAILSERYTTENHLRFCELLRLEPGLATVPGVVSWAAEHGDLAINELVLRNGGNVCAPPYYGVGLFPIFLILKRGDPELVALYLAAGVDANERNTSAPSGIQFFFEREGTIYPSRDANAPLQRKSTYQLEPLLHAACREGSLAVVEVLLQHGADIQGRNAAGDTCLFTATEEKNVPLVRMLLSHGIDADIAGDDGETVESWLRANKVDGESGERWPEMAEILEILTHWRAYGVLPESE